MNQKKKHTTQQKEKEKARKVYYYHLRPLLYAFAGWFTLLAILHIPEVKDHVRETMVGFTHFSAIAMGRLLFLPVSDLGNPIMGYDNFTMRVILECTAYNFYAFVLMITLFARWPLKHKFINLLLLLLVINIANNMRFLIMGVVGKNYPQLFHHIHDYFWNILFAFLVFLVYIWADRRAGGIFGPIQNK